MKKHLLLSAALAMCLFHAGAAEAQEAAVTTTTTVTETTTPESTSRETTTVTTGQPAVTRTEMHWETVERTVPATGTRVLRFPDFDVNKDGLLSRDEVGQMLFKLYDTDGNQVIDNIEYERKAVVTVMPMERTTTVSYDFDGDGKPDQTEVTQESFMRDTLLTRFDANRDGLSPHEFTGRDFLAADVDRDRAVELNEWQGSYIESLDKANKDKARLNNRK